MPTITAQSISDKAGIVLQDVGLVRWTAAERLGWINDGQREICTVRHEASNATGNVTLVAGTKQTIPTAGYALIKATRNMGVGGATPGEGVRLVPMAQLDYVKPTWHADTPTAVVKNYMYDSRTPHVFFVWPPSNATTQIEVVYATMPADVAAMGNAISIDDVYAGALLHYLLFRAYSKDLEIPGNAGRAAASRAMFDALIGHPAPAPEETPKPTRPE